MAKLPDKEGDTMQYQLKHTDDDADEELEPEEEEEEQEEEDVTQDDLPVIPP